MTAYGTIPKLDDDPESTFEEYNVDYVQERKLSPKERMKKILTAGLPIVIALLLVLGFGLWTTKALSPGPSTHSAHTPVPMHSEVVHSTPSPEPVPSPTTNSKSHEASPNAPNSTFSSGSSKKSSAKACSANPECDALGLIGDCCPTSDGKQLGCCK